jgi:hypothetical protein
MLFFVLRLSAFKVVSAEGRVEALSFTVHSTVLHTSSSCVCLNRTTFTGVLHDMLECCVVPDRLPSPVISVTSAVACYV